MEGALFSFGNKKRKGKKENESGINIPCTNHTWRAATLSPACRDYNKDPVKKILYSDIKSWEKPFDGKNMYTYVLWMLST